MHRAKGAIQITWFKVDDRFHSHLKVLATDPAALGLWVVAGSWSSANLTEGFVPDNALPRLLPDSATLASALVTASLWRKVRGGYQFHDWTDYNPTAEEEKAKRQSRSDAGRKGGVASGKARSKQRSKPEANASPSVAKQTNPVPSRPNASNEALSPPSGSPPRKRGTRLPDPFPVSAEMRAWAQEHAPTCGQTDHDAFCDYWRGIPGAKGSKLDWPATWRNWMRKEHERRGARASPAMHPTDQNILRLTGAPLRALPGGNP